MIIKDEEDKDIKILSSLFKIKYNKELNPLIIVEEKNGPYVLEGSHRMSACVDLGLKEVPAIIVIDIENFLN